MYRFHIARNESDNDKGPLKSLVLCSDSKIFSPFLTSVNY
ncbi:hypothetical protein FB99_46840 (plasmid) [Pantoea agglomerans]|nr:hypothetical protein FB99_46840 [Pantoea agglomerans]